jgi:hypothetical protein
MKKFILLFLLIFLYGCETHYKHNYQINNRKTPIIIVAIDTSTNSVVMIDGDNKLFTIYNNPTTKAITCSRNVGDS